MGAKTQVHQVAKDISGHCNDLPLVTPPQRKDLAIDKVRSQRYYSCALSVSLAFCAEACMAAEWILTEAVGPRLPPRASNPSKVNLLHL